MLALLSRQPGGPDTLALEELPDPRPGPGQVLIAVKACGVNYPDLLIIEDRYQFKPERPFAPGSEVSGIVEEVGEGVADLEWRPRHRNGAAGAAWPRLARSSRTPHPDAGRHAVRRGGRLRHDVRYLLSCAEGPRCPRGRRNTARPGRRGRRRPRRRRASADGHGGAGHRGGLSDGKVALAKAHGALDGIVYPAEFGRQGGRQRTRGPVQGGPRAQWRRRGLRPGRRRIRGSGLAGDRGKAASWSSASPAGIPKIPLNLPPRNPADRRRVLGRLRGTRPEGQRAEQELLDLYAGERSARPSPSVCPSRVPARPSQPSALARPWARSWSSWPRDGASPSVGAFLPARRAVGCAPRPPRCRGSSTARRRLRTPICRRTSRPADQLRGSRPPGGRLRGRLAGGRDAQRMRSPSISRTRLTTPSRFSAAPGPASGSSI